MTRITGRRPATQTARTDVPDSGLAQIRPDDVGRPNRTPDPRRTLGAAGEAAAGAHLSALGYEILETNWRCREGEIDIVARDGDEIVVVEVKTRRSARFGRAVEAVTHDKHLRLRRLARLWMNEREVRASGLRIDVIGVEITGREAHIDHRRRVIL